MKNKSLILVLCDIRSTLNVGAIFRTADAVGADKIYLSGITATPNHPKVAKTALGAESFLKWEYCHELAKVISKLKKADYQIIGLELGKKSISFWEADYSDKIALLVGNEVTGLTEEQLNQCNLVIKIPMFGKKESLNVATATGVAAYQIKKHLNNIA